MDSFTGQMDNFSPGLEILLSSEVFTDRLTVVTDIVGTYRLCCRFRPCLPRLRTTCIRNVHTDYQISEFRVSYSSAKNVAIIYKYPRTGQIRVIED